MPGFSKFSSEESKTAQLVPQGELSCLDGGATIFLEMQRWWEKTNDQDVRGVWVQVLHGPRWHVIASSKSAIILPHCWKWMVKAQARLVREQDVRGIGVQVLHGDMWSSPSNSPFLQTAESEWTRHRRVYWTKGMPWGRSASACRWYVIASFKSSNRPHSCKWVVTIHARLSRDDQDVREVEVQALDGDMWSNPADCIKRMITALAMRLRLESKCLLVICDRLSQILHSSKVPKASEHGTGQVSWGNMNDGDDHEGREQVICYRLFQILHPFQLARLLREDEQWGWPWGRSATCLSESRGLLTRHGVTELYFHRYQPLAL